MATQNKITVKRGNTLVINYTNQDNASPANPISMAGGTVYFTVKTVLYDTDNTDSAAVLSLTQAVVAGNTVTLKATAPQTLSITPATYNWDLTVKYANGDVITPFTGSFVVTGTPTNRGSV